MLKNKKGDFVWCQKMTYSPNKGTNMHEPFISVLSTSMPTATIHYRIDGVSIMGRRPKKHLLHAMI